MLTVKGSKRTQERATPVHPRLLDAKTPEDPEPETPSQASVLQEQVCVELPRSFVGEIHHTKTVSQQRSAVGKGQPQSRTGNLDELPETILVDSLDEHLREAKAKPKPKDKGRKQGQCSVLSCPPTIRDRELHDTLQAAIVHLVEDNRPLQYLKSPDKRAQKKPPPASGTTSSSGTPKMSRGRRTAGPIVAFKRTADGSADKPEDESGRKEYAELEQRYTALETRYADLAMNYKRLLDEHSVVRSQLEEFKLVLRWV